MPGNDPGAQRPTWNPRYLIYARSQGHPDPDEMLRADRERYPGGVMAGFMIWIQTRWVEFRQLKGWRESDPLSHQDHREFTAWIDAQVPGGPLTALDLNTETTDP